MSEQEETAARPSGKNKRRPKQNKAERSLMELATVNFAACGRCSYFWGGSQVLVGQERAATAVAERQDGWMTLPWSQGMANLLHKSYGGLVDSDFFHYEGCCQECRRAFEVFWAEPEEEMAAVVEGEEGETAVAEKQEPPTIAYSSLIFDLEKYDALDDPSFKLPPTEPPASPYTFRIQLTLPE